MAYDTDMAVVSPPTEPVARSPAAERMRRHRQRRRNRLRCLTIELPKEKSMRSSGRVCSSPKRVTRYMTSKWLCMRSLRGRWVQNGENFLPR